MSIILLCLYNYGQSLKYLDIMSAFDMIDHQRRCLSYNQQKMQSVAEVRIDNYIISDEHEHIYVCKHCLL